MTLPVTADVKGRVSLTGRFAQLNISLLIGAGALLVLFGICVSLNDSIVKYVGGSVSILLLIALFIFAIRMYLRQEVRPEGTDSAIELRNEQGQAMVLRNPPDRLFAPEQIQACARSLLLGYDQNLCPDGKVLGKASDNQIQMYSDEEKQIFMEEHRTIIKGKKSQIGQLLLEEPDDSESANKKVDGTR